MFDEFEQERRFRQAWNSVSIARPVTYSLFTFGESVLPYYLVCGEQEQPGTPVTINRGQVRIKRPTVITPDSAEGQFRNFFQTAEEEGFAQFLLARTAHFSNWELDNQSSEQQVVSDSMEETVDRLNRQLDEEDEDRVAILTAEPGLAGLALLRYAVDRMVQSAPDNIQELRERGFLP